MTKLKKERRQPEAFKEPTDEQLQGNQHDKIIKESIEETMYFMLKTFGNIEVVKSEQLPTDIQQTKERKPDFLKIITDISGVQRIGHLEFHVKDEADISYRAFETCAMMKRKKPHLGIFQIIVYMGEKPADNILTEWSDEHYTYRIRLIQFIRTPVEIFLQAESAAEVVLGVLGDFGDTPPEIILPQLIDKVIKYSKTDLERLKFLKHLHIFSKLRNFEPLTKQIMENVIAHFGLKDEDDYMYKKGEARTEARFQKILAAQKAEAQRREIEAQRREVEAQKRLEQIQRFTVIELLDAATLTEDQIIKVFEVTAEFIQGIKNDLTVAPKKIARLKKTLTAEQIARQLQLPINWVEKQLQQA